MRKIFHLVVVIGLASMFAVGPASTDALDGRAILSENCASCHNLTGPAPRTYDGVLGRKAPDLFYAGSKFNRPWLARWLQNPTVIRRSGVMFLNHIVNEDGKDLVNEPTIKPCAANLGAEEAEAVTDHLMTLTDPAMKTGIVDPTQKHSKHKAYNLFSKRMPCIGCHRITFAKKQRGGISGPDLTNAGERLNPDWIYARIENPQYWDAKTWMPKLDMSHGKRELLTQFLASMK
jgi:cbb3-type cytochrome oxidase cytochrome c subunit